MNKYLYPLCSLDYDENTIETIQANSLEQAYEKLSEVWDLEYCECQDEFFDEMYERGYVVGQLLEIDEL